MAGSHGGVQAAEPLPPAAATTRSTRSPPSPDTMVLDNDDLLCLILFRLAFPVSLIRAALVCKRWLSIASDPAFLHRFRKVKPPLLGFYVKCWNLPFPTFVGMPHTEELSSIICRASSVFDEYSGTCWLYCHSQNGPMIGRFHGPTSAANVLLSPLNPEGNMVTLLPLSSRGHDLDMIHCPRDYLLNDQACLGALLELREEQTTVHLYELIDGV
ncbi:hypothetical protein ACQ4PT_042631 [Festuca glaucescens]